jgi:seryl-tRNA synthetase
MPEDSERFFEELKKITVEIFEELEVPIRVLEICSGDLGDLKNRQIDIEAWSPKRKEYYEVGSCSNLTDAQARRLNIKFSDTQGNKQFVHTLNNTAIATSRALVAIIENYQNADGTINIPTMLQKYMHGKKKIQKLEK